MPRPKSAVPAYCHHRSSNRAFIKIDGKFTFLGRYDSPESKEKYARLIREYTIAGTAAAMQQAAQNGPGSTGQPADDVTVAQVLAAFLTYAQTAYAPEVLASGRAGRSETENYRHALKPVAKLYASLPATEFGPKVLRVVRDEMVKANLCLTNINRRIHRVLRVFRWAVGEEMIAGEVIHRLEAVEPLRRGTPGVRVTPKVLPVSVSDIEATIPYLPTRVAAMVRIQQYTGMRSSNVCKMRMIDLTIDDKAGTCVYRPSSHKSEHHGHELVIPFGPRAQEVLKPFLRTDVTAFLFSPAEGEAERRSIESANRKTPTNQGNKPGHAKGTKRRLRTRYDRHSYAQAITRGIAKARESGETVNHWHPHQLRHRKGTDVRKAYGIEGVQASIGVSTAAIAEHYAEIDQDKAQQIAREIG